MSNKRFVYLKSMTGRSVMFPCQIPVPVDGGIEFQELNVRFRLDHVGKKEHEALLKEAEKTADFDAYIIEKVVDGFANVPTEDESSVDDASMFELMRATPYIQNGVLAGYLMMREGRLPKNFVRPSVSISEASAAQAD
jgi:hypothetical protein